MSDPIPNPPPRSHDDATSGAFWRSLSVLGLVVLAVLLVFAWDSWRSENREGKLASTDAPSPLRSSLEAVPQVPFTDITATAGIRFQHYNGATGEKLLPETMGAGVAIFDADGDGRQDLLFVNGNDWSWTSTKRDPPPTAALYRNLGHGRFEDITRGSGLDESVYGTGVAVGDYDNDGRVDVFLSGVGDRRLFRNEGEGKFRDVTKSAGLLALAGDWTTSAAWLDFDNDGDLDLFVCQYVRWSREIDLAVDYRLVGIGRAYGPPDKFPGSHPLLYRNDGRGRFTDVSAASGVQVMNRATHQPMGKCLGVSPVDLDRDGWMDIVVANDTVQNFVFHNEHNGQFREIGALSGIAFDSYGGTRGAMGIDAARTQEDDQLAIAIGNFANEMTAIYVSQRDPLLFSDEAIGQGIGQASRLSLTFGVFFFDYDLDGWLDFLTANGHIEQEIGKVQKSQEYRQPATLFWNGRGLGPGTSFVAVPESKTGPDLTRLLVGRGSAFGDLDGDGDLDVVITQVRGPPLLLRNDQQLGNSWLRLRLQGVRSNRDGIGSWIKLTLGNRVLWRQVMPTRGYLSQSELPVTIGLGKSVSVSAVQVLWPSGLKQNIPHPQLGTETLVVESPP